MTETPYAPPQSPSAQPQVQTGEFNVSLAVKEGWEHFKPKIGVWIGGTFVFGLVAILAAITVIGYFVVLPVLFYGYIRFTFEVFDGRGEIGDIFSGFKDFGGTLGPMLVLFILMFVIGMIGQVVSVIGQALDSSAIQGIGGLINLVWTFAVAVRFYFASYFLVDQQMSAVDALRASWNATTPQLLRTIGFMFVIGLLFLSGLIALGVGIFITAGIASLAWVSAYRQMTRGAAGAVAQAA